MNLWSMLYEKTHCKHLHGFRNLRKSFPKYWQAPVSYAHYVLYYACGREVSSQTACALTGGQEKEHQRPAVNERDTDSFCNGTIFSKPVDAVLALDTCGIIM